MLALYKRLLRVRREHRSLQLGRLELADSQAGVLAYRRTLDDESLVVAVNFADSPQPFDVDGRIVVSSDGAGLDEDFGGTLAADQAIVVSPVE